MRKGVFGVGVSYCGHDKRCYIAWSDMLKRCYSERYLEKNKTYEGCIVSDEWLFEVNFYDWWKENYVPGWQLDKDLLVTGNKIYSKDTCVYIPAWLNSFATIASSSRGGYMPGVSFHSAMGKFQSTIRSGGVKIHLGYFDSELLAHIAWFENKIEQAYALKEDCNLIHEGLYDGLVSKVKAMLCFNHTASQ